MTYIYYIPHVSFFSKHPYGRVAHALGVANGIAENGFNVLIVAEQGVELFKARLHSNVSIKFVKKYSFFSHLFFIFQTPFLFNSFKDGFVFIYRKTILSLILMPFFHFINIFKRPIVIAEVNGFIFDYKINIKNKFLIRYTELWHKLILSLDTYIYTVNDDIKNILSTGKFSIKSARIFSIHNGGPVPNFINFDKCFDNNLKLVFFGILADYNELDLFIDVLNRPSLKGKVNLEIVGFGPQLQNLIDYSKNNSAVNIHGKMTFDEFSQLLMGWDCKIVGIVPMRIGNKLGSLSPIKAFDYMSFALPLIYSDLCLDGIIENNIHGYQYKNGNIDSLELSIIQVMNNENFLRLSDNVRKNYRNHTWKARMNQLLTSIS